MKVLRSFPKCPQNPPSAFSWMRVITNKNPMGKKRRLHHFFLEYPAITAHIPSELNAIVDGSGVSCVSERD